MVIKAKRIYEPKKDDNFDIQKVLGDAIQKSITSSTDQTKQLVSEFERMSSDAGVKKLEEKFYQYIKNLRIEKEEIKQDVYKSIENRVNEIGRRVENHEHKEYLTQEDKDECINSARDMVNEAVLKFDNLFKPFLEQLNTKSDKEHTHSEFEDLKKEIEENEKELKSKLEKKAEKKHTHKVRDVEKLQEKLDKKADKEHKHDEYATRQELEFIAMQKARGAGGGGHVIQGSGVVSAQRSNLNFIGATVTDDPNNNATIVTVTGGGSGAVDSVNGQTGVVVLDQDDIGDGATYKQYSDTEKTKLDGIEAGADVTDATNVNAAGAVMNSDYTPAHSILVQQSGTGSPTALQIGNNTLVGRLSGGGSDIDDLTSTDVRTLLSISNVDNTSDLSKPISTATQTALDLKQPDIQFKDEGINAGTSGGVTIVDFVGAGVTASESAGTLTVTIPGGGGSPGGVDTDVQYNDGGVFNGGVLKYNKTTKTYTLVDTSAGSGLQVISGNTTGPYGEIDTTNGSGMIGGRYVDLNAFTTTYRFKSGVYPSFHTLELMIQHTANRTIYVPDADGTLALTSDLGAYSTFVALTDTPASYTGEAGKVTAVNGTEDGLEFIDIPTTSPGGTVNEIQFNNAGVFGSVPGFSRDGIDLIFAYPGGDTYVLYMQDAIQMTTGTLSLGALDNKIRLYGPGLSIDLALDTSDITASRNQLLQDRDGYIALTNIKVEANTDGAGSPNIITGAESSTLFTNEGTTAKNYHTLPTAVAGLTYTFYVADSDGIRVVADTGNFILVNGVSSTSAGYCDSISIGSSITLTAINATDWVATSSIGTRTLG